MNTQTARYALTGRLAALLNPANQRFYGLVKRDEIRELTFFVSPGELTSGTVEFEVDERAKR